MHEEQQQWPQVEAEFVKVRVSSVEAGYLITYNSDGTGSVYSESYHDEQPFNHSLNLEQVKGENVVLAVLEDFLISYYWQEINPVTDDPLIQDYEDLDGYEIEFVQGNQVEFDRLMHLFILTEPKIDTNIYNQLIVEAAAPEDEYVWGIHQRTDVSQTEPCLCNWSYSSERIEVLLALALKEHRPFGYTYEYNDQAYDRMSGYSPNPAQMIYQIDEILQAPAREKMAARQELSKWLIERGENPADYGLDWEKIV